MKIQKTPLGFLDGLRVQQGGEQMADLVPTVQPVADTLPFYLSQNWRTSRSSSVVAGVRGDTVTNAVTAGETWRVIGITCGAESFGGLGNLRCYAEFLPVGVTSGVPIGDGIGITTAAIVPLNVADFFEVGFLFPEPAICLPGSRFRTTLAASFGFGLTLVSKVLYQLVSPP